MGSPNTAIGQVSIHCQTLDKAIMGDSTRLIAIITALFFPPISVLLIRGCGCDLLINILLTLAFAIPGMIHAFWIVLRDDSSNWSVYVYDLSFCSCSVLRSEYKLIRSYYWL